MTVSAAAALAALLAGPVYHADRSDPPEARVALLAPVAEAIATVARTPEEAAVLVAIARHESHLARYVLEGRCHEGPAGERCDNGKARGPWQVWNWCRVPGLVGEASCVLSQFRFGQARCRSLAGGFTALAGAGCSWSGAAERVVTVRRVLPALRAGGAS